MKKYISLIMVIIIVISSVIPTAAASTKDEAALAASIQIGDVNGDGTIGIDDATAIQKKMAGLTTERYFSAYADFDRSGKVGIDDVTMIQRYCAGLVSIKGNFFLSDNGATLYSYFGTSATVNIPSSWNIKTVRSYAFSDNSNIQVVTFSSTVTKLEDYAFYNCSKLTTIYSYNKNLKWGISFVNCPLFQSIKFK